MCLQGSENYKNLTSRASRGKPIVPIVFFQETTIHFITYGERHIVRPRNAFFPRLCQWVTSWTRLLCILINGRHTERTNGVKSNET